MSTDPKKNFEVKDEELERVAGGGGGDSIDEQPADNYFPPPCFCEGPKHGRIQKI